MTSRPTAIFLVAKKYSRTTVGVLIDGMRGTQRPPTPKSTLVNARFPFPIFVLYSYLTFVYTDVVLVRLPFLQI